MKYLMFLTLLALSPMATANYYCSGKVAHLGADSSLLMSNGFGVHRLCVLTDDKCKAWLSFLTAAKLADRTVLIYYRSDSSQGGEQNSGLCQTIGTWVTPADPVYYVQMQ